MNAEHAIKSLKRVHDSALRAETASAPVVTEEYNEVLERLREEFPENEFVQSVHPITEDVYNPVTLDATNYITPDNALERVKVKSEQLADALDLGPEFERLSDSQELQRIVINQEASQSNAQVVDQNITVESVMELIELDPQVQHDRETVEEIVKKYEAELENDEPDIGVLRALLEEARNYSTGVAARMGMIALERGLVDILGV